MSTITPKRKAARCLFGTPNKKLIDDQLNSELRSIYEKDRKKWNFDFRSGIPIVGGSGDYHFEAIPAEEIPPFYHEKHLKSRKTNKEQTPLSDLDDETMYAVDDLPPKMEKNDSSTPTTSSVSEDKFEESYQKPITRSATRLTIKKHAETNVDDKGLKQTKLTNYMPVRKRRSETCLVSMNSTTSMDQLTIVVDNAKRNNTVLANNVGAPRRPVRFVPPETHADSRISSVSDTSLVTSPRSPPMKRSTRRRRQTAAGDF